MGGPLEKKFFETCFNEFKMIGLKKKTFLMVSKQFEDQLKILKIGRKKV